MSFRKRCFGKTKNVARNPDWEERENRQVRAGHQADGIVSQLGLSAPIDPLAIVASKSTLLLVEGGDFRNAYDGKLKYVRNPGKFLLFYNNKYDTSLPDGEHHPRTRFSIAHELGHYFIKSHHRYLLGGGTPHGSRNEFRDDNTIEREADSFAASILLPRGLAERDFNSKLLSIGRIQEIADQFNASLLCTAFRAVRLSDDPCALVGIRGGHIAWMFRSDALAKAGLYPKKTKDLLSQAALRQWQFFPSVNRAWAPHKLSSATGSRPIAGRKNIGTLRSRSTSCRFPSWRPWSSCCPSTTTIYS